MTDSYKESFGVLQKAYKYGTRDDITKEILDDIKSDVKDQVSIIIDETIDESIGLLDETAFKNWEDYLSDKYNYWLDDVEIGEPTEDYNTDDLIRVWNGTVTINDYNMSTNLVITDATWPKIKEYFKENDIVIAVNITNTSPLGN